MGQVNSEVAWEQEGIRASPEPKEPRVPQPAVPSGAGWELGRWARGFWPGQVLALHMPGQKEPQKTRGPGG